MGQLLYEWTAVHALHNEEWPVSPSSEVAHRFRVRQVWAIGTEEGRSRPPSALDCGGMYVTYDADPNPHPEDDEFITDKNARLSLVGVPISSMTINAVPRETSPCYTAVNYLGFDSFGHYRQTSNRRQPAGQGKLSNHVHELQCRARPLIAVASDAVHRGMHGRLKSPPTRTHRHPIRTTRQQIRISHALLRSVSACAALPGAFISRMQFNANGLLTCPAPHCFSPAPPSRMICWRYSPTTRMAMSPGESLLRRRTKCRPSMVRPNLPRPHRRLLLSHLRYRPPDIAYSVSHALTYASGALDRRQSHVQQRCHQVG